MNNKKEALHKHHIIPKFLGGTDEATNLVEITRKEHAQLHLQRYKDCGHKEDLGAYYLLTGQTDKSMKVAQSLGGKVQGKINAENGHMVKIQKLSDCSAAGKKGALSNKILNKGSFYNKEEHRKAASKGGKVQGKVNAENGHLQRISKLPRKYKPKKWITNGEESKIHYEGSPMPTGFYPGRIIKKK